MQNQNGIVKDGRRGDVSMPDNGRELGITDYQDALKTLTRDELERLHKALLERLQSITPPAAARRSLLDLEGLGAEMWGSLDAQLYVDHERDSRTS
jgi:hypothetical protein